MDKYYKYNGSFQECEIKEILNETWENGLAFLVKGEISEDSHSHQNIKIPYAMLKY